MIDLTKIQEVIDLAVKTDNPAYYEKLSRFCDVTLEEAHKGVFYVIRTKDRMTVFAKVFHPSATNARASVRYLNPYIFS